MSIDSTLTMCQHMAVFSFKDTGSSILKATGFVSLELKKSG